MTTEKVLRKAEAKRLAEEAYREKRLLITAALIIGRHGIDGILDTADTILQANDNLPVLLRPEDE